VGDLWVCPAAFGIFLVLIPVTLVLERRRLRNAERAFLAGRRELADVDFLRRMGAECDRAPLYLVARRVMAGLCGIPPAMIHPDDTVRSVLDLQFDNGFIEDFVWGLELQGGVSFRPANFTARDPHGMAFGAFLQALAPCCEPVARIVLRVDLCRLCNPDVGIRRALADLLAERSGGVIRCDGHGPSADTTALLLFLSAERSDEALACIADVVEQVPVLDNDLRSAVVAALQRPDGYTVIYPHGFEGLFAT
jgi:hypothetical protein